MRQSLKILIILLCLLFVIQNVGAQILKLRKRQPDAIGGKAFGLTISDSTLTLEQRETIIFKEIKSGNVPDFLRKLNMIKDTIISANETTIITLYVLPDYFCIGSNADFLYLPMTPILAQKVADLTNCSLPTKKMVDLIYKKATIKLSPQPIPPTKNMTTIPVFIAHTDSVLAQLSPYLKDHNLGSLTAGNKKDIIISNKIYGEKTDRVVIYGWHKLDGKAIQPVYNKHSNLWADYSHGLRLVQQKITINGKKISLKKALQNSSYSPFLCDEDIILNPFYPITDYRSTH